MINKQVVWIVTADCSLWGGGEGEEVGVTALVQTNALGQSASNSDIGQVLHSLIDFLSWQMTAAKTKPAKHYFTVLMEIHFSAATIHWEI